MDDTFPVARLGRLLNQNTHTIYRDVRHGRYGAPFKIFGRYHVKVAAVERAAGRRFAYSELRAALAPPKVAAAPDPLDIQLRTTIEVLDGLGHLYTREQVRAIVEHNLGLRDLQWLRLQKQQMNQQMPDGRAIIPDNETITREINSELEELQHV